MNKSNVQDSASTEEGFVTMKLSTEEAQKVEIERSLEETLGGVKAVVQLLLAKAIEHREWTEYDKPADKNGNVKHVNAGSIDMLSGEAQATIFNASSPSGFLWEGKLVRFSAGGFRNQGCKVVAI